MLIFEPLHIHIIIFTCAVSECMGPLSNCQTSFMPILAGDGIVSAGTDEPAVPTGVGVGALWGTNAAMSSCFLSCFTQALADLSPPSTSPLVTPPPKQNKGKTV